jgi:hypothetical protein
MEKIYLTIITLSALLVQAKAQTPVTGIYSDYNGFWVSTDTTSTQPDSSHNLFGLHCRGCHLLDRG